MTTGDVSSLEVEPPTTEISDHRILKLAIEYIPSSEFEPMMLAKARLSKLEEVPVTESVAF